MRRSLATVLAILLDKSASLGVGLADEAGLLIETQGLHGGHQGAAVAALLSRCLVRDLGGVLGDAVHEQVILGERYAFYLLWTPAHSHFLYAMTERAQAHARVRQLLGDAMTQLAPSLEPSAAPLRERLEQPRQFRRDRLLR